MRMRAAAPSFIFEAFAAVMVPVFEKAGLREGNFSGRKRRGSSSLFIFISLPLLSFSIISTISQSNNPLS
jgi:hypothetical protein